MRVTCQSYSEGDKKIPESCLLKKGAVPITSPLYPLLVTLFGVMLLSLGINNVKDYLLILY